MTTLIRKKRAGRPATGRDPNVGIRIPKKVIVVIDRMAREQHTTRAAIIREIVMKHLGFNPSYSAALTQRSTPSRCASQYP
jgi:hypothetical protein